MPPCLLCLSCSCLDSPFFHQGKLNAVESIELTRPVLARNNGIKHIEEWLKKDQLECSEELVWQLAY